MNIDRKLNLVVPVQRDDGVQIYVHASPISREAFDANFLIIAKTFTELYNSGLGHIAGPRVAAKLLRKEAEAMGQPQAVEQGLFAEIRRLSNVLAPSEQGWTTTPFQAAISQNLINAEDVDIVENILTFFTLASAMHTKKDLKTVLEAASGLWDAQVTLLNATGFADSLRTSTKAGSSGETAPLSSIPS